MKIKKIITIAACLVLLLPSMISAEEKINSEAYYYDDDYMLIEMKRTAVTRNTDKNEIIFKNSNAEDTSTYIIDEKTLLPDDMTQDTALEYVEGFVSGRYPWVHLFIPISKNFEYSKKQNEVIRIPAIFQFAEAVYKYGGENRDPIEEEYSFLETFGIIAGNEYGKVNLDIPVSRGEMAQILLNMLWMKETKTTVSAEETFLDVEKSHKNYDAVHLAMQLGHISGYGDGTFGPENPVTNEQAVKMLVSMLGYAPRAEEQGGYPKGYWSVAEKIGLLENTALERAAEATQGGVARLLMNAVYLPVMEQTTFGEMPVYTVMDGEGVELVRFFDKYLDQPYLER